MAPQVQFIHSPIRLSTVCNFFTRLCTNPTYISIVEKVSRNSQSTNKNKR